MKLRPYQRRALEDIKKFLKDSEHTKGLLVAPVGCGKSILISLIADCLKGKKLLVVQPSEELLKQNLEKARNIGLNPTVYSASLNSKDISTLTYATPMSLVKNPELFKDIEYVCIDESHLFSTNQLKNGKVASESKFNQFLKEIKPKKIIGLTATPIQLVSTNRGGAELKMLNRSKRSFWFGADIFHITQIADIKNDYWAKLEYRHKPMNEEDLVLNSSGSDFREESIITFYENNDLDKKIIDEFNDLRAEGKRSILIFVPSIEIADRLASKCPEFRVVSANTNKKDREEIVRHFKIGKLKGLVNVATMTTGFDHPELDAIILARNTNSFALYHQIIGRICRPIIRPDGTKFRKTGTIVDFTNNYERFGGIENISYEKQDYTSGWAMWNGDRLMTGFPFGNWNMPSRESVKRSYEAKYGKKSSNTTRTLNTGVDPDKLIMPIGKYKGKSAREIFERDRRYVLWMMTGNFNWSYKNMLDFKEAFKVLLGEGITRTDGL
jgi:DNA repair protein RadD